MDNSDVTEKKVFIKRNPKGGWVYMCPHCLKRLTMTYKMKECNYCAGRINPNQCVIYKGKVE